MKIFFLDTNVFLRFILKDNLVLWKKAENYFLQAKEEKIHLIILPEIILEIEYVLRKVYGIPKLQIYRQLSFIATIPYVEIRNREIISNAVNSYVRKNVDLLDLFLFYTAAYENAQVLSFDKDFKKLDN